MVIDKYQHEPNKLRNGLQPAKGRQQRHQERPRHAGQVEGLLVLPEVLADTVNVRRFHVAARLLVASDFAHQRDRNYDDQHDQRRDRDHKYRRVLRRKALLVLPV